MKLLGLGLALINGTEKLYLRGEACCCFKSYVALSEVLLCLVVLLMPRMLFFVLDGNGWRREQTFGEKEEQFTIECTKIEMIA